MDLPDPDKLSLQQTIERNEMSACVQRHLADLPDSYHAVILLHDQYGLIGPEIAETLGASLATVKIRLHRARHRLQATLEAGCAFSLDVRDSETRLRLRGLICMILLIQSADDMEA